MSTQPLQDFAEKMVIPKSWIGIIAMALSKWGIGIVIAAVFWHEWREERSDARLRSERLMSILENRARVDAELGQVIAALRTSIVDIGKEARDAHRWPQQK